MSAHANKQQLWKERIEGWQSSGLSQREYCAREELSHSSFNWWRRRIKTSTQPVQNVQRMTLVPVPMASPQTIGEVTVKSPAGWEVTAPVSSDVTWLSALLKSLT